MLVRYLLLVLISLEERIMQISSDLSSSLSVGSISAAERPASATFADVFKKVVTTTDKAKTAKVEKTASQLQQEKEEAIQAAYKAVVAELNDYMKKSPAEHMRDAVLKELGLTEADLDAMPPDKRMAMEATINERIREKLLGRKAAPEEESASAQLIKLDAGDQSGAMSGANMASGILSLLSPSGLPLGQAKAA